MSRFFFHVHDDVELLDEDGIELAGWDQARLEAIQYAGHALADRAQDTCPDDTWTMDVIDESGFVLFRLEFSIIRPGPESERVHPRRSGLQL